MTLLTRDEFRTSVFARDHHTCVICKQPGQDAHHIYERRLWPDGGYYISNGATLCSECHLNAESTEISVEEIRAAASITEYCRPPHLYRDDVYDKWGNICLPNGLRLRGELFDDASVQKAIRRYRELNRLFSTRVKYPRTHHLPWSPGATDDDRFIADDALHTLLEQEVIITEKMDGENTTMYRDYVHARSLSSMTHPSQSWVKQYWATKCADIPEYWRVCGENLYATHSIKYESLENYFLGFSIWNDANVCLSWDDTIEYFDLLGIRTVPVLFRGKIDQVMLRLNAMLLNTDVSEGYVIRAARSFTYREFRACVAKYVRENHVQSSHNWRNRWNGETNLLA